jgi:hypothetical protein
VAVERERLADLRLFLYFLGWRGVQGSAVEFCEC